MGITKTEKMHDDAYSGLPSTSYRCEICRSEDVMYDDEGYIVCNVCGGASQYRMVESNEGEDVAGIYSASMTIRTPKAKYRVVEKEDKKDTSLYDLCRAFQYCLKLSLRSAFLMFCPSPTKQQEALYADLVSELKALWFAYLEVWEGVDSCEFKSSFTKVLHCTCPNPSPKESSKHPPFPSKPLLLAFVYISMSRLSFPILPADLVRGVERGALPYHTLWAQLPLGMRTSIHPKYRHLWQDFIKSKTFSITPMNIFFQVKL
ncbi:hypothetical protein EON65_56180 [archaeon]|nr:MAG: hypothetical protein EON65_56180 [archaeon]